MLLNIVLKYNLAYVDIYCKSPVTVYLSVSNFCHGFCEQKHE